MRLNIGRKIAVVIVMPAILAAALAIFAYMQERFEHHRVTTITGLADLRSQTNELRISVQTIVIAADAVAMEQDRRTATTLLDDLKHKIRALDGAQAAFVKALGTTVSNDRKSQIALRLKDFKAYQTDIAELGLTVSPRAAQIQAMDAATIENRQATLALLMEVRTSISTMIDAQRAEIDAQSARAMRLMEIVPILSIVTMLGLAVWVVRSQISRPLVALKACMAALAKGHLETAVPYRRREDEIGEVADTLVVFRDALVAKRDAAMSESERLSADARRAAAVVDTTRAFETHALGLMQNLSTSVTAMDAAANDVATTSDQTREEAKTVWQAADDATTILASVSAAATELSHSVAEIAERIGNTHAAAQEALREAAAGDQRIEGLVKAADEIGGATSLIDAIARQTNLLALNATIEAARAGEYGRGFAVVAGEVKTLAQQTAAATAEINGQVEMIQTASAATAQVMHKIRSALDAVASIAANVATSAIEQGRSSETMAEALVGATERARIVSESIGAVNEAAIVNGSRASELRAKAVAHAEQASRLSAVIVDFVGDVRRSA